MNRIDHRSIKQDIQNRLRQAQIPPKIMTALYLSLSLMLSIINVSLKGNTEGISGQNPVAIFAFVLTNLTAFILEGGFILYCMGIYRGERVEYWAIFDGFSLVGKIILLQLLRSGLIMLWSSFFFLPGLAALYRYRFALYIQLEEPEITAWEAIIRSTKMTRGYKFQLLLLDIRYLPWLILAYIPLIVNVYFEILEMLGAVNPLAGIPAMAWIVIAGLWRMTVSLFFLAQRRCVELAYYYRAKGGYMTTFL